MIDDLDESTLVDHDSANTFLVGSSKRLRYERILEEGAKIWDGDSSLPSLIRTISQEKSVPSSPDLSMLLPAGQRISYVTDSVS